MWYVGHINAPARPSEQIDRRLTRAHNRYLSALRALAAVRSLDLTLVNVNSARDLPGSARVSDRRFVRL
jgi:hypothetical protein